MALEIRDARATDCDAIAAINAAGRPGVNPFEDGEIEACIAKATYFRVAEREGSVAAYLLAFDHGFRAIGDEYAWFQARHPAFLYVDQIAVAEWAWRGGVGTALYLDLEREARSRGIPRVTCEVNLRPPNPRSLAFHAARGFREVGRLEVRDGRFVSLLELEVRARPLEE